MDSILVIPVTFAGATSALYWLSMNVPDIDQSADVTSTALKFPSSMDELSSLARLLNYYKENHAIYVLVLFVLAYLYKQTFAIPGSVFLNLLGGAIYGLGFGFPLTCILTAAGATNCYLLSWFCGKKYIVKYFPDRIKPLQKKVEENSDSLFFFLLFLRLFPMSPNWFMNMTAPILNVPIHLFFLSVFIGLMPYNFMCVQTGCLLSEITSVNDILTLPTCIKMIAIATVALLPGLLMKKFHKSENTKQE